MKSILTMKHPVTGEPIKPLYVWRDGRISWPVMGASPDDPSNTGGGAGGDGEPGGTGTGAGTGTGTPAEGAAGEVPPTVSQAEFERQARHLAEADRKREEAENKLKAIEDSKKDELTKATEKVAALETALAAKDAELLEVRLDNAFMGVKDLDWHDKKTAIREARAEGYLDAVIKDGKVDEKLLGMKLNELAKAKPYLVKATQQQEAPLPPSGGSVGSGGKGPNNGAPEEALLKGRYRTLNR